MTKLLASTAVALLIAVPAWAQDLPQDSPQDPAEVAAGFYEGLNGGGAAAFEAVLADDWIVHGTSPSLPSMDFEQYISALSGFAPSMGESTYTIEAMHVADDIVTVRGTIAGTHEGPLFGVPATGNTVEFGAIDIHRIEDGRIAESWHIEDFLTVLAQINGMPAAE